MPALIDNTDARGHSIRPIRLGESPLADPFIAALFREHRDRATPMLTDRLLPVVIPPPAPAPVLPETRKRPERPISRLCREDVAREVEAYFGFNAGGIGSKRRSAHVVYARYIFVWIVSRVVPAASLMQIAYTLNRGDHTTVMHAKRRAEDLYGLKERFRDDVEVIMRRLMDRTGRMA